MATTPISQDSFLRQTGLVGGGKVEVNIDLTQTIKQGQFLKNATVGSDTLVQPATLNTDGPNVSGIAAFSFPLEDQPFGPEAPSSAEQPGTAYTAGVHAFRGKNGQRFVPGAALVIDEGNADGQTVRLQGGDGYANVVAIVAEMTNLLTGPAQFGILGDGTSYNVPVYFCPPALGRNNGTTSIIV